jgi:uncharacterized Rmd1/YagE family protein
MKKVSFNCFKIASRLPLDRVASHFEIRRSPSWQNFIVLESGRLDRVFKYSDPQKKVYLFDFGCIVFINFDVESMKHFIGYLNSITGNIDYSFFTRYSDSHIIEIMHEGTCSLWQGSGYTIKYFDGVITAVSLALARSTALMHIENRLASMLDESERFIEFLQKGRLRAKSHKFAKVAARVLSFEYETINNIRIFDRFVPVSERPTAAKEAYKIMEEYYELLERFEIMESKIEDLKGIVKRYHYLSHNTIESRLLIFEIFLLALFPLSYFLEKLF